MPSNPEGVRGKTPKPERSKPRKNWIVKTNHIKKTKRNKNTIQSILAKHLIGDRQYDPDWPDIILKSTQFHSLLWNESNLPRAKEDIFLFNAKDRKC